MTHAEKCPVCYGSGAVAPTNDWSTTTISSPKVCHGCGGRGWVTVGSDYEWNDYKPRDLEEKK